MGYWESTEVYSPTDPVDGQSYVAYLLDIIKFLMKSTGFLGTHY